MRKYKYILSFLMLFVSSECFAEQVKLPNTEIRYIKSKINNVNYRLYISLPKGYNESKDLYPVVYLLDQDYSFAIAHNVFEHLSDRKDLPKSILVSIGYDNQDVIPDYKDKNQLSNYKINRTRDYTPISTNIDDGYGKEYDKFSGGGELFKKFIKNELMPFIKKEYKTNEQKTIIGHSYGGLFTTWIFLTDNEMFDNYIAISPSLWFQNNWIFSLFSKSKINKNSKLYITVGDEESMRMIKGVKNISEKLKNKAIIKSEIFKNENHNTIFPTGMIHGGRFVFNNNLRN